jgi:hypothetical protein
MNMDASTFPAPAPQTIDITPNPRILRVLGEIPFHPWQCIAELVDNSIDAFAKARREGRAIEDARIDITWSDDNVASDSRMLEVTDNGLGMGIDAIRNAVRAGYTSNDPTSSLGLFGMGFNIATARVGEITVLLSAQATSTEWQGVRIDLEELAKKHTFAVPVVSSAKTKPEESGTRVQISKLKEGMYKVLRDKGREIRRTLEDVYAPILREGRVKIYVNNVVLKPRPYCVWGASRSVIRDNESVPAWIELDHDLGNALFDTEKNQYLPGIMEADLRMKAENGEPLPSHIIERPRRLKGWLGIQRYADPQDFGVDFIRNGRKILRKDKHLFSWENPMGDSIIEYPVELGTTQGGRIIGELHVDFLIPTYQKNDFDRTESAWYETVQIVHGEGPVLPRRRKEMAYTDKPTAPLARLMNAYRRMDPGTKNLSIRSALAKDWAKSFMKGDDDFVSDEKWWRAAIEADRQGAEASPAEVDEGVQASDDPDTYSPSATTALPPIAPVVTPAAPAPPTTSFNILVQNGHLVESLSGEFRYGRTAPLKVRTREVREGNIEVDGNKVACTFFQDADECDFFYNPRHPLLAEFPLAGHDLLTLYLAERFKARDNLKDIASLFDAIYRLRFADFRLDRATLQERAEKLIDDIRQKMVQHLAADVSGVLQVVREASGEVEETMGRILGEPELMHAFQNSEPNAIEILNHVPTRTLSRIIDRYPQELFDDKVFKMPFLKLDVGGDPMATERMRNEAKKKLLSYLEDAISLTSGAMRSAKKDELGRAAYSLNFLEKLSVE